MDIEATLDTQSDLCQNTQLMIDTDYHMTHLEDGRVAVWYQEDNIAGTFSSPWAVVPHFTRHALTQAVARGISKALIKQVILNGKKSAGNKRTSIFTQGKDKNKIRVIVPSKTSNIITATKG